MELRSKISDLVKQKDSLLIEMNKNKTKLNHFIKREGNAVKVK